MGVMRDDAEYGMFVVIMFSVFVFVCYGICFRGLPIREAGRRPHSRLLADQADFGASGMDKKPTMTKTSL